MATCPFTHPLDLDSYREGMPYQQLAALRKQGSFVHFDDPGTGVPYWLAVKRDALDFVSQNPKIFSSQVAGPFPMEPRSDTERETTAVMNANSFIAMDPPQHMAHRRVVRDAFTPRAVAAMEPWLREQAKAIVDRVAGKGACEFVEEVAAELPLMAILELLGVPQEDRKQFFEWTNIMAFADDPDISTGMDEANTVAFEVMLYAMELAKKQRQGFTGPVIQALLEGDVDGVPVSDEMFAWVFILLMVGGNESTRTALAHGMRLLMEHPDQLQHLVDHPEDIPTADHKQDKHPSEHLVTHWHPIHLALEQGLNDRPGKTLALLFRQLHRIQHDLEGNGIRFLHAGADIRIVGKCHDVGPLKELFTILLRHSE